MSLQDESRRDGRTILPNADPDCRRCGGSGWYMKGLGGDFEDCDCTVVVKAMASPGRYAIAHPSSAMTVKQRAWEMWAVHPSDLDGFEMTREEFYLAHLRAAIGN